MMKFFCVGFWKLPDPLPLPAIGFLMRYKLLSSRMTFWPAFTTIFVPPPPDPAPITFVFWLPIEPPAVAAAVVIGALIVAWFCLFPIMFRYFGVSDCTLVGVVFMLRLSSGRLLTLFSFSVGLDDRDEGRIFFIKFENRPPDWGGVFCSFCSLFVLLFEDNWFWLLILLGESFIDLFSSISFIYF